MSEERIILDKLKKYPLSTSDIKELMHGKIKVITYPELYKYDTLDELLEPYGVVIINYLTEPTYGHWTAIKAKDKDNIYFFDSYAIKPDREKEFIDKKFLKDSNQKKPYLSYLLYDSKKKIHYNEIKLQDKEACTCGRWCVLFCYFKDLGIKDFSELFLNHPKYSPDDLTILATSLM